MTLYLKYRPKNLDELDLPQVSQSLKKILNSNAIPHAFLFSGPKGTGKTSAARILAKVINCEHLGPNLIPCDKCEQCASIAKGTNLDVIEMDAASHRGIDDVRTLKDAVKLAPTSARKKIYIIDEAHMLTSEASNALLKTLEEPPEHVIFVLATTNPEKLIDTIRSRTTSVNFRKAGTSEIVAALKRVVEGEKIKIADDALTSIAEASGGAFRDAIKMLEQFSLEGDSFLSTFEHEDLAVFLGHLAQKNEMECVSEIEKYAAGGKSIEAFAKNLLTKIHSALLAEVGVGEDKIEGLTKEDLLRLAELFSEAYKNLSDTPIEHLPLEIAVVKWCGKDGVKKNSTDISENQDKPPPEPKPETRHDSAEPVLPVNNFTPDVVVNPTGEMPVNDDIWKKVLVTVRPINASIEGLLRSSKPLSYDGRTLTLGVFYKFHKERLEDNKHRKIVEDVIGAILNSPTRVVCMLTEPTPKKVMEEAKSNTVLTEAAEPDIIKAAEEIFGN